jgi:DNA-binding NarL/FixJ family response regulator
MPHGLGQYTALLERCRPADDMSHAGTSIDAAVHLMSQSALDRLAYRRLLADELHLRVVADSDFRPASVWAAMRCRPDLILVDADTPHPDVVDALQMIARLRPEASIVAISVAVDPQEVEAWGRCPLQGYVVKDGGVDELRTAVDTVLAGREYFSPNTREPFNRGATRARGTQQLSRREAELLPLLARGLTLREAALQMTISYKTADSYRSNLLRKLGIRDRVELARYAIRQRIIDP